MVCNLTKANKLAQDYIDRAKKLGQKVQTSKEGEVYAISLKRGEKVKSLLEQKNFDALDKMGKDELKQDLAAITARELLSDSFEGAIRETPTQSSPKEDLVFKNAKFKTIEVKGVTKKVLEVVVSRKDKNDYYPFMFEEGQNVSLKTASGKKLRVPRFKHVYTEVNNFVEGVVKQLNAKEQAKINAKGINNLLEIVYGNVPVKDVLGAVKAVKKEDIKFKARSLKKNYVHGNVEDMRNVLSDLFVLGGKSISNELYDYYHDLLGSMHKHFFTKMDLYIEENTEDSEGFVVLDPKSKTGKILLNMSSNPSSKASNAEVYMHEVIHTMTSWALSTDSREAQSLREQLNFLMKEARSSITWQDLQKADPTLSEEKDAKERYDYIFNSQNADDEFMAYALTNPAFMTLLKSRKIRDKKVKGLFNTIFDFFADMMNAIMGNYSFKNRNQSLQEEIHSLAFRLAEINNKADEEIKKGNLITKANEIVEALEGRVEEFLSKAGEYVFDREGAIEVPKNMNFVQAVVFTAKVLAKGIYNHNYRHQAGRFFSLLHIKPDSTLREIGRSLLPSTLDDIVLPVELAGLKTSTTDLYRNTHVGEVANSIINNFNKSLNEDEETALTEVLLESNGSVLFKIEKNQGKGYSDYQLNKIFSSIVYRKQLAAKVEKAIRKYEPKRADWIINQAKGLGKFMVTGKGHIRQNMNSQNISKGYLSDTKYKEDITLTSMIEELVALSSLNHRNSEDVAKVGMLLRKEKKGVKNIVQLYEAFKEGSKKSLFSNDVAHIMEGYTKELYDDSIQTTFAPLSEKEELEKQGYTLVSQYESNEISGAEAVGFFVTDSYSQPERVSGAVSLGNPSTTGMTLKEARYVQFQASKKHAHVWFEADKAKYDKQSIEVNKALQEKIQLDSIPEGPIPVVDAIGNVVDYRFVMPKKKKSELLKQNKKVTDVLSKTSGSLIDKEMKEIRNEEVLKIIKDTAKNHVDSKTGKHKEMEFTFISEDSSDPEIRKLFYQLPESYRAYAKRRADKSLPIPSILMHQYFGYSHARFSDAPGINKLPSTIKKILNMIEEYWVDGVKIAKGNILLKMPVVLVVNIISNILYAINTGTSIFEIAGMYKDSIRSVGKFMEAHKELEQYKVEMNALSEYYSTTRMDEKQINEHNDKVKVLHNKMKRLAKEMEGSPIKELFDLGLYQAVIEDVNMYKLGDTNKISDGLDTLTAKLPTTIRQGAQILYLSKETKWYQYNQKVLQMSDLVARDVMNRKQKQIEKRLADGEKDLPLAYRKLHKMDKKRFSAPLTGDKREKFLKEMEKSRHANLVRSFVNYNSPNGKGEEYLNRIGVLMFTKYVKRIQNVIGETATQHPIKTMVMLMAVSFGMNLEMIQDQSFLTKFGDDYGVFGLTPLYTPIDILLTLVNPPLVELVTSLGGFA